MLSFGAIQEEPILQVSPEHMMLKDGSVVNLEGQIIWFSIERFHRDICIGNCCLLCGAPPSSKPFNDEHIIPDWLLRKHGLHSKRITLPNRESISYDRYKIPCCTDCNSLLGRTLEKPIRETLSLPYNQGVRRLQEGVEDLLVIWLHLIFVKTHLKDTFLKLHQDERKPKVPLSSLFHVKELHHAHTIFRSFFTETSLAEGTIPSLHIFACTQDFADRFDYFDLTECLTMALQTGEYIFIMSLDDAGMAGIAAEPMLEGINGPINPLQIREVVARLGFANLWLEPRPDFYTKFSSPPEIAASVPSNFRITSRPRREFGELFAGLAHDYIQAADDPEFELEKLKSGETTFLYDGEGRFSSDSLRRTDKGNQSP